MQSTFDVIWGIVSFDYEFRTVEPNNVASDEFLTATCFYISIDLDLAILDQQFGLTASSCDTRKLEELVQADGFGLRLATHGSMTL